MAKIQDFDDEDLPVREIAPDDEGHAWLRYIAVVSPKNGDYPTVQFVFKDPGKDPHAMDMHVKAVQHIQGLRATFERGFEETLADQVGDAMDLNLAKNTGYMDSIELDGGATTKIKEIIRMSGAPLDVRQAAEDAVNEAQARARKN